MTCNITERFFRIVAGATLFVLLTAANTAFSEEPEENIRSGADSRTESSSSTDSNASAESQAEGDIQVAIFAPDTDSLIGRGEAVAETTFEYVETVDGMARESVAWTERNAALDSRAQAEGNASTESNASTDGDASTDGASTDGNLSSNSNAGGDARIDATAPDAAPMMENAEAFADASYHFVDDLNATAQDAVAETVAQEVGAAVDASVKEDVRASVQEDLQSELNGSLPLPGRD